MPKGNYESENGLNFLVFQFFYQKFFYFFTVFLDGGRFYNIFDRLMTKGDYRLKMAQLWQGEQWKRSSDDRSPTSYYYFMDVGPQWDEFFYGGGSFFFFSFISIRIQEIFRFNFSHNCSQKFKNAPSETYSVFNPFLRRS